jgi:hypothetical protein
MHHQHAALLLMLSLADGFMLSHPSPPPSWALSAGASGGFSKSGAKGSPPKPPSAEKAAKGKRRRLEVIDEVRGATDDATSEWVDNIASRIDAAVSSRAAGLPFQPFQIWALRVYTGASSCSSRHCATLASL